jgi:hypothetical protein
LIEQHGAGVVRLGGLPQRGNGPQKRDRRTDS